MADFNTNPGDRSVTELEREVDRERARVSATIDELQARASTGNLVDQVVKAVGENGGEISRNLGRSLRDNPLAAILTGVGLAWLMAGPGRSRPAEPDWESSGIDRLSAGRFDAEGSGGWSDQSYGSGDSGSSEGGLRERVADMAEKVGEGVSGVVEGARERASDIAGSAGGHLRHAGDTLRHAGDTLRHAGGAVRHQAGDTLRHAGGAVRHQAGAARRQAAGTGDYVRQGLDNLIEEQPLAAGAIALALGAAIGGALPRSSVEDRMFGEQSDRAMATVRDLAKDHEAKLHAAAGAVVEEVKTIAGEASAAIGSELPSGKEIVEAAESKVREAAERVRDASGLDIGSDRESGTADRA
jgi:hypothetical protein